MAAGTAASAVEPQGAERRTLLDAARGPVAAKLAKPVRFKVERFERVGDWAFLLAAMQDERGQPIAYTGTALAEADAMGMVSKDYVALLRRTGARWRVVDFAIGPSDVAWEGWAAKHGAPSALFRQ